MPAVPEKIFTVFAGQDVEATERARSYFTGYPPSSPSIALLRDGKLIHMMQRSDIEHREAADIATELKRVFGQFCASPTVVPSRRTRSPRLNSKDTSFGPFKHS